MVDVGLTLAFPPWTTARPIVWRRLHWITVNCIIDTLLHSLGRPVLENIQFSIRFCTYPLYGCANTASFELCIHLYYPPTCATTYETMFCSQCEHCFKYMHPVCRIGVCTCIVICIGHIPYICHTLSPHVSVWNVVQCLPTILHRLSMSVGSVPTLWP